MNTELKKNTFKPPGVSVNSELETVRFFTARCERQQGPLVKLQPHRWGRTRILILYSSGASSPFKDIGPIPLKEIQKVDYNARHSRQTEAEQTCWSTEAGRRGSMSHTWMGSTGAAMIKTYQSATKRRNNSQVSNLPGDLASWRSRQWHVEELESAIEPRLFGVQMTLKKTQNPSYRDYGNHQIKGRA